MSSQSCPNQAITLMSSFAIQAEFNGLCCPCRVTMKCFDLIVGRSKIINALNES